MVLPVGVSEHIGQDMLMGRDIPHFRQLILKELKKEPKKEEPTSPDSIVTEYGMVVTRAQLLQQTALEEEERLQQEQDVAIVSDPYLVNGGKQAEETELVAEEDPAEASGEDHMEEKGTEKLKVEDQPEKFSAEAPGESQTGELETEGAGDSEDPTVVLAEVLTKEKLGEAQRYDKILSKIKEKAGKERKPYFWKKGISMQEPYQALGKSLIIVHPVARERVLRMAHHSSISGHFGKEGTLHMILVRVDWSGIVRDVNEMCASCPVCQKAGPAIMARAPLLPLPVIREPFT